MSTALLQAGTAVHEGRAVVTLAGELDMDTAPGLSDAVARCLAERPDHLRIDLSGVSFCDCAGLNVLLRARLTAREAGVSVSVDGVQPQPARLFALAGADEVFAEDRKPARHRGTGPAGRPPSLRPQQQPRA